MRIEPMLRLATWNMHMGIGADGRRDLERSAQVIKEISPDLMGLQEVDNCIEQGCDDIKRLQEMTGLEIIPGPTMQKHSGDYGNALLTRLPVLKVERYDISVRDREPRGILVAHIDWSGEGLQIAVTHLGLRAGERRYQVKRLVECLAQEGRSPLILMGDFNEWLFWGRPLRWLHQQFGRARTPATFPARLPLLRLDHILAHPPGRLHNLQVHISALSRSASDHLPLTATFVR